MAVSLASVEPKSSHVADSSIRPFLEADFDPVAHLNSSLPTLSLSSTARSTPSTQYGRAVPLPELAAQLQNSLSQLNTQATRLSNALTQLTDEIIRSGGRLEYEVDVLRGETLGLTDALDSGLKKDIELFAPKIETQANGEVKESDGEVATNESQPPPQKAISEDQDYLERLRSLTAVRAKLDAVIKVFDDAMQWPIAPSELSVASSFISVAAPDSSDDGRSREEKGKTFAENLRNEINELLVSGADRAGIESAEARIAALRSLSAVWKGTAEEKARTKAVDNLQKLVDERQRSLEKTTNARKPTASPSRGVDLRYGNSDNPQGGYGFLQNLRNLRSDVYLE